MYRQLTLDQAGGEGDASGPWNEGEQWEVVSEREAQEAVDGGDGHATVALSKKDQAAVDAFMTRTMSDPESNPITGADLGAGPGAGRTTPLQDS